MWRRYHNLVIVFSAICCSACAGNSGNIDVSGFFLKIEMGSCFGDCPAYVLTVNASGQVKYHGSRESDYNDGSANTRISQAELNSLIDAVENADFFHVGYQVCDGLVGDAASFSILVSYRENHRELYGHYGCKNSGDDPIVALVSFISELVDVNQWNKRKSAR